MTLRADSGFYDNDLLRLLDHKHVDYTITVRRRRRHQAHHRRDPRDRLDPDRLPDSGVAEVAATVYKRRRLIVRRVRHDADPDQGELFATWQHHGFVTCLPGDPVTLDAFHRGHATVELGIRDLKPAPADAAPQVGRCQRRLAAAGHPGRWPARPAYPQCPALDAAPAKRLALAWEPGFILGRLRCVPFT